MSEKNRQDSNLNEVIEEVAILFPPRCNHQKDFHIQTNILSAIMKVSSLREKCMG